MVWSVDMDLSNRSQGYIAPGHSFAMFKQHISGSEKQPEKCRTCEAYMQYIDIIRSIKVRTRAVGAGPAGAVAAGPKFGASTKKNGCTR